MQATVRYGAHPIPDAHGEAATLELLGRVRGLAADDLMVVLLSGGSSALLAAPKQGLVLADVRATTRVLLESGAPITAVNTVRRELLEVGGGGLARAASPARVVSMVLSDVLGDSLPDIACGPTVPSPTTAADALAALDHYRLMARVPRGVVELLGRRAAEPRVASREPSMRNRTEILGNNATAVRVAADALDAAGYAVSVIEPPLVGEASVRGRHLGSLARAMAPHRPTAVVVGGETTVTVRGAGHGGRNQELVLAAALELPLDAPAVVFSAGTDGIDGASENAGGVVDSGSADRMRDVGVDPVEALAENDSARALAASVDVIVTGPTGTNVCDLTMVLVGRRR